MPKSRNINILQIEFCHSATSHKSICSLGMYSFCKVFNLICLIYIYIISNSGHINNFVTDMIVYIISFAIIVYETQTLLPLPWIHILCAKPNNTTPALFYFQKPRLTPQNLWICFFTDKGFLPWWACSGQSILCYPTGQKNPKAPWK